ncbi:hypothetical protein M405DRAFT_842788 [Rhizopogon salebrosus TDB-379]|nr:hypothetical protein M405DRAFT_842788 [Rhizopogon salebrosus TDB-379]
MPIDYEVNGFARILLTVQLTLSRAFGVWADPLRLSMNEVDAQDSSSIRMYSSGLLSSTSMPYAPPASLRAAIFCQQPSLRWDRQARRGGKILLCITEFFPLREEPEAYCPDDNTITVDCSSVEYFGRVPSLDLKAAMRHSHAAVHDTFSYDRGRGAALVLQACFSRGLFEIQICLRYAANTHDQSDIRAREEEVADGYAIRLARNSISQAGLKPNIPETI